MGGFARNDRSSRGRHGDRRIFFSSKNQAITRREELAAALRRQGKWQRKNWYLEIRNWTLEAGSHRGRRSKTNPMELKNFISTEYKEKARNKPNVVMHNDINALRGFLASFPRNMYDSRLRFHSRFGTCYMLSMGYNEASTVLGKYGSFASYARSRS